MMPSFQPGDIVILASASERPALVYRGRKPIDKIFCGEPCLVVAIPVNYPVEVFALTVRGIVGTVWRGDLQLLRAKTP